MMRTKMIIKLTAGLLAAVMMFTSIAAQGMAADANGKTEGGKADYAATLPLFMEVADQLDPGEAVTAEDIEITAGDAFDPAKDFTGITYDGDKVKVHFSRAEDPEGKAFSNKKAAVYMATYYAEPLSSHHDYRFTRKVTVKEKTSTGAAGVPKASTESGKDSGSNTSVQEEEGSEDETGSTGHSDRKDAEETPASPTEAEKAADSTGFSQTSEEETASSQDETEEAAEEQDTSVENTEGGKEEAAALEL